MSVILDLPEKEAFPKKDSDGVLCVLKSSTKSNKYVVKHLLTFVSNILAFVHIKKENYSHFFRSNLTLTLTMSSVSPLMSFKYEQIEALKKWWEKTYYMSLYDV